MIRGVGLSCHGHPCRGLWVNMITDSYHLKHSSCPAECVPVFLLLCYSGCTLSKQNPYLQSQRFPFRFSVILLASKLLDSWDFISFHPVQVTVRKTLGHIYRKKTRRKRETPKYLPNFLPSPNLQESHIKNCS